MPFLSSTLTSCNQDVEFFRQFEVNFSGNVLIIGAGAAGLMAGHLLRQNNISFQILEASDTYGGRVKEASNFADFPIDLGAEWIHTNPSVLARMLNDPNVQANIDIINYNPESIALWDGSNLKKRNFFNNFYGEYKFKNTTWFSFFDDYIVPGIANNITLNSPVTNIDYTGSRITVTNAAGNQFEADRVIVTVPLTVLQRGSITFTPALPQTKTDALQQIDMPDGIKVFMEFSERFYPDLLGFGSLTNLIDDSSGEKLYYNAAFRKNAASHVLGLFTVGEDASFYTNQPDDNKTIEVVINELDQVFEGKASRFYKKHVIQNWSKSPYVLGSYSFGSDEGTQAVLKETINNKIYFAGEAYATPDSSTVHGAGESAFVAVEALLKG
ncbi:hypothetical protein BKI52_29965 [marine bacterium AO1-C]|nr:hypothetical protein BKI52_29965 [marine bacterium AO1-C]